MILIYPKGRYLRHNKVFDGDNNIVFSWHVISAVDVLASDWTKQILSVSTWSKQVKSDSKWSEQTKVISSWIKQLK